ncbi:MAG: nucleoside deaminase [Gemmataceae bacterium]
MAENQKIHWELLMGIENPFHLHHMDLALEEAELAYSVEEVPVGAVIVDLQEGILAQAHNQREQLKDPTAHAEMIALTQAATQKGSWRLDNCVLYATLEPCPMCAGAIVQSRISMVVYGCRDPKAGACHSLYRITEDSRLNHQCRVLGGVRAEESAAILGRFFRERRAEGKK